MNKFIILAATLLTVAGQSVSAAESEINTGKLIESAVSASCVNWRISGMCTWMTCTPIGCSFSTSPKVSHYIPDVVVSAQQTADGNPWTEMKSLTAVSALEKLLNSGGVSIAGGQITDKTPAKRIRSTHFKYSSAFGHPASALIGAQAPGPFCDSEATPYMPYFMSTLDTIVWRTGIPEMFYPESSIPGLREIGSTGRGKMWGAVYPRNGFVTQQDDYKAAAIVAQRVADIITRAGQLHVYQPLTGGAYPGYWPPGAVKENSASTHKWQRLSPQLERACRIFPDISDDISASTPRPYEASDGNYAWALWRPYSCCKRMGTTLISTTSL